MSAKKKKAKSRAKPEKKKIKTTLKKRRRRAHTLTAQQRKFIEQYLIYLNATAAAKRSGYSPRTAKSQGQRLLKHPLVAAEIKRGQEADSERAQVTKDEIISELKLLGFANMEDYLGRTPRGDPYVDLSALTRAQAAAIKEITVEEYTEGTGDNERDVKRVKLKLSDKRASLVDLGRHVGLFSTKVVHQGPGGGPIPVANFEITRDMTPEEAARIYREFIKAGK